MKEEIQKEIRVNEKKSTLYTQHIKNARIKLGELNSEIVNIRTSNKDEDLKKCSCEAELKLSNGNSIDLLYTVQLNEKEEKFVELQMLK